MVICNKADNCWVRKKWGCYHSSLHEKNIICEIGSCYAYKEAVICIDIEQKMINEVKSAELEYKQKGDKYD